jgi:hypothetical protein
MSGPQKLADWLTRAGTGLVFAISTSAAAWSDSAIATKEALEGYLAKNASLSPTWEAVNLPIPKSSKTIPAARHRASGLNCAMPKDTNLARLMSASDGAECFYVSGSGTDVEVAIRISLSPANDLSEFARRRFEEIVRQLDAETTIPLETRDAWEDKTKQAQLKFGRDGKIHFMELWFTKAGDWCVEVQSSSPDTTNPFYRYSGGARLLASVRTNPVSH